MNTLSKILLLISSILMVYACSDDNSVNDTNLESYNLFYHEINTKWNYFIQTSEGNVSDTTNGYYKTINVSELSDITISIIEDSTSLDEFEYSWADSTDELIFRYNSPYAIPFKKNISSSSSYNISNQNGDHLVTYLGVQRIQVEAGFFDTHKYMVEYEWEDGTFESYTTTEELFFAEEIGLIRFSRKDVAAGDPSNNESRTISLRSWRPGD